MDKFRDKRRGKIYFEVHYTINRNNFMCFVSVNSQRTITLMITELLDNMNKIYLIRILPKINKMMSRYSTLGLFYF